MIVPGAVLWMSVSAYCIGPDAPGPHTKAGTVPRARYTVAADPALLELGTAVNVTGVGPRVVEDVGHAIKGPRLDLFMASCADARAFGRQGARVVIIPRVVTAQEWDELRAAVAEDRLARVAEVREKPGGVDGTRSNTAAPLYGDVSRAGRAEAPHGSGPGRIAGVESGPGFSRASEGGRGDSLTARELLTSKAPEPPARPSPGPYLILAGVCLLCAVVLGTDYLRAMEQEQRQHQMSLAWRRDRERGQRG